MSHYEWVKSAELGQSSCRSIRALRLVTALGLGLACVGLMVTASGCVTAYKESVGGETTQVFSKIYLTDFNTAWQAVLDSLKSTRLDVTNREGGFVQTKWTENTAEKNFVDSFGSADAYLKAQYRLKVTVSKGFYNGQPSIKVTVQKDQLVQIDVLEGWRPIVTDSIDENTLLYRIGRIITIKTRLAQIERERIQKAMEDVKF